LIATPVRRDDCLVAEFEAMASRCTIHIDDEDSVATQQAVSAAIAEVKRIEQKFSRYTENSIIARINRESGNGVWIDVDDETRQLLDFAHSLWEGSDGLFDITSGVLRRAWNFREPRIPTEDEIATLLPLIDWRLVERGDQRIRLARLGMEIDFGGFGKEYAADCAANVLRRTGFANGFVNLGGDIAALGPRRDGRAWSIGIQHPREEASMIASIEIASGALATSGDYERFFESQGKRYCHILNPCTGMPVSHWQSVSVLAPVCTAAGAIATIAMLREAKALDLLEIEASAYLAIRHDGERVARP
jgi:FAD:protein FMN transferase